MGVRSEGKIEAQTTAQHTVMRWRRVQLLNGATRTLVSDDLPAIGVDGGNRLAVRRTQPGIVVVVVVGLARRGDRLVEPGGVVVHGKPVASVICSEQRRLVRAPYVLERPRQRGTRLRP